MFPWLIDCHQIAVVFSRQLEQCVHREWLKLFNALINCFNFSFSYVSRFQIDNFHVYYFSIFPMFTLTPINHHSHTNTPHCPHFTKSNVLTFSLPKSLICLSSLSSPKPLFSTSSHLCHGTGRSKNLDLRSRVRATGTPSSCLWLTLRGFKCFWSLSHHLCDFVGKARQCHLSWTLP